MDVIENGSIDSSSSMEQEIDEEKDRATERERKAKNEVESIKSHVFSNEKDEKSRQKMSHERIPMMSKTSNWATSMTTTTTATTLKKTRIVSDVNNFVKEKFHEPHTNDVLSGRGGGTNNHPGNGFFRLCVGDAKHRYISCTTKRAKSVVARSIIDKISNLDPPGRFLQKRENGEWGDIGIKRALEKTAQALREGAPDLKNAQKAGFLHAGPQFPMMMIPPTTSTLVGGNKIVSTADIATSSMIQMTPFGPMAAQMPQMPGAPIMFVPMQFMMGAGPNAGLAPGSLQWKNQVPKRTNKKAVVKKTKVPSKSSTKATKPTCLSVMKKMDQCPSSLKDSMVNQRIKVPTSSLLSTRETSVALTLSPKYPDKEGFPSIPLRSEQKHKENEENFIEKEAQNAVKKLKERKQKKMKQKQYSPSLKNTRTEAPYADDHTKLNDAVDDLMADDIDDSIPPPPPLSSSSTTVAQKIRQARLEREMSPSPMSVSSSENSSLELFIPPPALRSSSTTVLKKRAYSDGSENQSHVSEYSNNCVPPPPALRSSSTTDVNKKIKDIPKDYDDLQCPLPLPRALRSVSSATVLRLLEKMEENAKLDLSGLQTDCSKYFTSEYCSTSSTSKNHTSQTKICDGNSPLLPPPPMLRSSSGKTVSYGSSLEMSSIKHKPPMFGFNSDTNSVGVKDASFCPPPSALRSGSSFGLKNVSAERPSGDEVFPLPAPLLRSTSSGSGITAPTSIHHSRKTFVQNPGVTTFAATVGDNSNKLYKRSRSYSMSAPNPFGKSKADSLSSMPSTYLESRSSGGVKRSSLLRRTSSGQRPNMEKLMARALSDQTKLSSSMMDDDFAESDNVQHPTHKPSSQVTGFTGSLGKPKVVSSTCLESRSSGGVKRSSLLRRTPSGQRPSIEKLKMSRALLDQTKLSSSLMDDDFAESDNVQHPTLKSSLQITGFMDSFEKSKADFLSSTPSTYLESRSSGGVKRSSLLRRTSSGQRPNMEKLMARALSDQTNLSSSMMDDDFAESDNVQHPTHKSSSQVAGFVGSLGKSKTESVSSVSSTCLESRSSGGVKRNLLLRRTSSGQRPSIETLKMVRALSDQIKLGSSLMDDDFAESDSVQHPTHKASLQMTGFMGIRDNTTKDIVSMPGAMLPNKWSIASVGDCDSLVDSCAAPTKLSRGGTHGSGSCGWSTGFSFGLVEPTTLSREASAISDLDDELNGSSFVGLSY